MIPILSLLVALPILGALAMWVTRERHARRVAAAIVGLEMVLSLLVMLLFDPKVAGFQFTERATWIPSLNIGWHMGVDGLSVLFLPMTALLFGGVVVAAWKGIHTMTRLHLALLLTLEGVTMGIFCALDTMLFFLFWELTLVPIYFLVSLWGIGPDRRHAAGKYTMMMLTGGVLLLFGFLLAAFAHAGAEVPGGLVFDLPTLLAQPLPVSVQWPVFLLLLLGFAVKVPVVPLHTWLPTLAMEGPVAVAAAMTGLKLGAYGLIRFALPMAPDVATDLHWLLAGLGVAGVIYGALAALAQTNLRRLLAFASLSHVGLVLLGVSSFDVTGLQGAVYLLLSFPVAAGGLFLLAGMLHARLGSTELVHLGGVAKTMPLAAGFVLLFGLTAMGMPGTMGFPGELLVVISALSHHTGAGLAALGGAILGAAYFLRFFRLAFLGPVRSPDVATLADLRSRELAVVAVFAAIAVLLGVFPSLVLDITRGAAEGWVAGFTP